MDHLSSRVRRPPGQKPVGRGSQSYNHEGINPAAARGGWEADCSPLEPPESAWSPGGTSDAAWAEDLTAGLRIWDTYMGVC